MKNVKINLFLKKVFGVWLVQYFEKKRPFWRFISQKVRETACFFAVSVLYVWGFPLRYILYICISLGSISRYILLHTPPLITYIFGYLKYNIFSYNIRLIYGMCFVRDNMSPLDLFKCGFTNLKLIHLALFICPR
jgi:hypothetical protein